MRLQALGDQEITNTLYNSLTNSYRVKSRFEAQECMWEWKSEWRDFKTENSIKTLKLKAQKKTLKTFTLWKQKLDFQ